MAMGRTAAISATTASLPHKLGSFLPTGTSIGVVLGPLDGLVIWGLPLTLNPAAHRAFAIVGFLLVYWMTETMEHGVTALIGCLLFWFLQVAPPEIAFSGFTSPAAWFLFGALLIGQAVTPDGLGQTAGLLRHGSRGELLHAAAIGLHPARVCPEPPPLPYRADCDTRSRRHGDRRGLGARSPQ